jgi:hypothetical protein
MSASTTGTKTVTTNVSPSLTAALLTALLATPIENLTVAQLREINDALTKIPGGHSPTKTIGQLLV